MDADLALGRHGSLVPELETLAAKHPLRERFRGQLMLALYRSGRQAEALRVYGDARIRLADELGLEPGQALRDLEQAILRHDPSLDLDAVGARRDRPRELPRALRRLVAAATFGIAAAAAAAVVVLSHGGVGSSEAQPLAEPDSVALGGGEDRRGGRPGARGAVAGARALRRGCALERLVHRGAEQDRPGRREQVVKRLNTGVPIPCGLATGEGSVWVTDCTSPTLVRIDPSRRSSPSGSACRGIPTVPRSSRRRERSRSAPARSGSRGVSRIRAGSSGSTRRRGTCSSAS